MTKPNLEKMKQVYSETKIPGELDFVVNRALRSNRKSIRKRLYSRMVAGTCAAVLVIAIGINMSTTVANAVALVPGLEGLVKVISLKTYQVDGPNQDIDMEVPQITNLDNKELESGLNEKYLEENKQLYLDFQKEMDGLKNKKETHAGITTGYEIVTDNEQIFSILRYTENVTASTATTLQYDTIDKQNQVLITLPSLFKDEQYMEIISANIKEQMKEQMKTDPEKYYWIKGEDLNNPEEGFEMIQPEQSFYINRNGKLVIVFNDYEVAPGYMGTVEFEIPTDRIEKELASLTYIK
ncbi:DUF3298 and DUF4163 domain-containing protein [Paenibacillus sp. Marseille-Q4541]|uniref:DUF3298 and DUF4163 domain-containing protein n=1 Tax=Paenibacillus sp. Marseille-Q4541 TaxID=2831522 RepID=UPI001BA61456|nr:DUF3298 and DUF4163 domain-containing protein [Paenibacillus sp. Marseille-Q4541]